jgi:hypothetical protein
MLVELRGWPTGCADNQAIKEKEEAGRAGHGADSMQAQRKLHHFLPLAWIGEFHPKLLRIVYSRNRSSQFTYFDKNTNKIDINYSIINDNDSYYC